MELIMRLVNIMEAAEYISVDESFLRKRKGITFIKGVHFFKPKDAKIVRWNLDALDLWIMGKEVSKEVDDVLSNIL